MANRPRNLLKPRVGLAAGAVAFGLTNSFIFGFLLNWELSSLGRPDIAARGAWLLAFMMVRAVLLIIVVTLVAVLLLTRRTPYSFGERLWRTALGASVGALLAAVGANPITLLLQLIPWSANHRFLLASLIAAILILAVSLEFARRVGSLKSILWRVEPTA